jgi:deazaflavin-dependent oxidoreductase (nitroreductase family)
MPFPRVVAKTNRYWINPLVRRIAGMGLPFMLIRHVGRRSGRTFETPVLAFRNDDRFVIALTYGSEVDWLRNLRAAGNCEARFRGERYQISPVSVVRGEARRQPLPRVAQVLLALVSVQEFLLVDARKR